MAHIEVIETSQEERPNTEETNVPDEDVSRWLRRWTVFVCVIDFAYIVAIAVVVGILRGWAYSVHCFLLCLLILVSFVLTLKAKKKLLLKKICVGSCTTLVVVLMTTFTLLTRQAFYHPSSHIAPKWILFCLQVSIIPLVVSILVMYEFRIDFTKTASS